MSKLLAGAAGAAVIVLMALAGCGSSSPPAPGSPLPRASASAPSLASAPATAKACAELSAWQKKHGNSAAPPQQVSSDLISAPQPLSGDFTAWDLAVSTGQPDAEADLLKVWADCAKAEAAAVPG